MGQVLFRRGDKLAYFPDFAATARLGFQTGVELGQGQNALGGFIRAMLAERQQKRALQQEYGLKRSLLAEETKAYQAKESYKQELENTSPMGMYYNQLTKYMENRPKQVGATAGAIPPEFIDSQLTPDDYVVEPQRASFRGIPEVIPVPKAKPLFSEAEDRTINDIANTIAGLNRLEQLAPSVKTGVIEGLKFNTNVPFNKYLMGIAPKKEDIEFKSTLADTKATYVKAQSGVSRGFKEFQFLEVAMPEPFYPNDVAGQGVYVSIAEARRRMEINLRNTFLTANNRGKRLGKNNRTILNGLVSKYPLSEVPFAIDVTKIAPPEKQIPTKPIETRWKELRQQYGGDKAAIYKQLEMEGYSDAE